MRNIIITFFGLLVLYGCGQQLPDHYSVQNIPPSHAEVSVIGVGDVVDIIVFREDDLSGKFRVSDDGSVQIPLIGSTYIRGMTLPEAADVIAASFISQEYLIDPKVTLSIMYPKASKFIGEGYF